MLPQELSLEFLESNDIDFSFELYKGLYENCANPSLKEGNERDSSSEERLDYDGSDEDPVMDRRMFESSFNNNYVSLIDINDLEYKKNFSFPETLSVYDISMQKNSLNDIPLNVYPVFDSYQENDIKKCYNVVENVPSLVQDLDEINIPAPYILNIFGIPEKSRVETQVKLGIKLTPSLSVQEPFNKDFFWLKLPSWTITKEKLKLPNLRNHPKYIDPEKILTLEPSVVCASDITRNVLICSACIMRERKRAIRKKKTKFENESNRNQDSLSPVKDEEKKIILFNYPEIFRFKDNYINIPTRITCYCRHHRENIGFRILINIKDNKNQLIASTLSKPFMIIDDHKTISKIKKINGLHLVPSLLLPVPMNDNNSNQNGNIFFNEELKLATNSRNCSCSALDRMTDKNIIQPAHNSIIYLQDDTSNENKSFVVDDKFMDSESYNSLLLPTNAQQDELAAMLNVPSLVSSQVSSPEIALQMQFSIDSNLFELSSETQWSNKELHMNIDQMDFSNQVSLPVLDNDTSVELSANPIEVPIIDRLIPSEGPMHGGIEVTILGSGFHSGLTCIFGDNLSPLIHYWSSTVIVCTLPPSPVPGPVVVDFKERNLTQSDVNAKYFIYKDDNDRTLMELALQVVGMKMTGKLENALTIAMKICGLMPNDCNESNLKQQQSNLDSYKQSLISYLRSSSTFHIYKAYYYFETMFSEHDNFLNIKSDTNAFHLLYQDRPNQTLLSHVYIQELQRQIINLFSQNYYLKPIKRCNYNHVDYLNMKKTDIIEKTLGNTKENRCIYRTLYRKIFKLTYPNTYIEISNLLRLNREHMDHFIASFVFLWLNQNNFIFKKRSKPLLHAAADNFDDNDFFDTFFSSKRNNKSFKNKLNKTKKYSEAENLHYKDSLASSYNTNNESKENSCHLSQSQNNLDTQENQTIESNIKDEKNDDGIFTMQGFSEFLTMTSAKAKFASLSIPSILRTSSLPPISEISQFHPISALNSFIQQYPFINKKANSKSSNIMENDIQYNWWQHLIFGPPPPYSELSTNEDVFETSSDASEDFEFPQEKSQWYSFKWQPKAFTRSRTAEIILEQRQFIKEHAKIIQKLEKDKMLYLFWLPVLIILSIFIILNWTQKSVSIGIYDLRRTITFSI